MADQGYKTFILLYHQIGHEASSLSNLDCFCRTDQFLAQMKFLRQSNYEVISMKEAYDRIFINKRALKNSVVLSFDDGFESFYDIAFPILQECELPSIVFPVSGLLGKFASWINPPDTSMRVMTKNQLQEVSRYGVEIGSHTVNHPRLTQLAMDEAFDQIYTSKFFLEDIIGSKITAFAYPHGCYNEAVVESVQKSEYECALTCTPTAANLAKGPYKIPRKYITYHDDLYAFKHKLLV